VTLPALPQKKDLNQLTELNHAAGSDLWCLGYWLEACASRSEHTRRAYRREALRWLAFLASIQDSSSMRGDELLRNATYEHAVRYLDWIESPEDRPALSPEVAAKFRIAPTRPKNSPSVLRQAVITLHGMYEELASAMVGTPPQAVVQLNPFKPFRRRYGAARSGAGKDLEASGVQKALSQAAWSLLWEIACQAPEDLSKKLLAARRRLELAILRATWERRGAAAGITWADLRCARDGNWKIRRNRKGEGMVWAPVPTSVMEEIARFRRAVGLPAVPGEDEQHRSVFFCGVGRAGRDGPISDATLYADIKVLLESAADAADARGLIDVSTELRRRGAGPHSIRHTMATMFMASGGEARQAQGILGHSSIAVTTSVYDSRSVNEQAQVLERQWETSRQEGKNDDE